MPQRGQERQGLKHRRASGNQEGPAGLPGSTGREVGEVGTVRGRWAWGRGQGERLLFSNPGSEVIRSLVRGTCN